jgi:hypothetical protein
MSGALPVVSGKEAVQALQRAGFAVVSTSERIAGEPITAG